MSKTREQIDSGKLALRGVKLLKQVEPARLSNSKSTLGKLYHGGTIRETGWDQFKQPPVGRGVAKARTES